MSIVAKCKSCKRLGGYGTHAEAEVCARCERDNNTNSNRGKDGRFKKDDDDE